MKRYAAAFANSRLPVAVMVVLATAAAAWHIPGFEYDEDPRTLFRSRDASYDELQSLFANFGRDDLDCLIVLESEDFLTRTNIQVVRTIVTQAAEVEGVQGVFSMLSVRRPFRVRSYYLPLIPPYESPSDADIKRARKQAAGHPLLEAGFLSPDRKISVVAVRVREDYGAISQIAQVVDRLRQVSEDATRDLPISASVSGLPVVRLDHLRAMQRDQLLFNLLGVGLATLVATLVLRDLAGVCIVMGGPAVGVVWAMGLLTALGEQVNLLNIVIPPILMVIGLANAIHFLAEFKRLRHEGADRVEATTEAIRRVGPACGLATLTTAIGFASLALANADMIRHFGLAAAVGCGLVFVAVVTVVPLLTSSFMGDRIRWGRSPLNHDSWSPFARLLRPIRARSLLVSVVGAGATLVLATTVFGLKADNRLTEAIPRGEAGYQALLLLDRTFGGSMPASIVVEWPDTKGQDARDTFLQVLRETHQAVAHGPWSTKPISLLTLLESISPPDTDPSANFRRLRHLPPEHVQQFMRADCRTAIVRLLVQDAGAAALEPEFARLRERLAKIERDHPGYHLQLTGTPVVAFRNTRLIIEALYRSLALAALVVFVIVAVSSRSLLLGVLSIIPNAFPLAMTSAVLWATGGKLEIASVVVFSVCLGIATDDTIHFLARFQRERREHGDLSIAVSRTFAHMAEVMTVTTVVIATGFAAVLISKQPALRLFSKLALVALSSALIGDLLILPALLFTMARFRRCVPSDSSGALTEQV